MDYFSSIYSYENLFLAWERVKRNRGCAGSDGITLYDFERELTENLKELSASLSSQDYHPLPLCKFPVPKENPNEFRYLSVPTVRDRIAQTAAYLVLKHVFEKEFENSSHAYREGRGVQTAIQNIMALRKQG
ncbi:hypothetical protein GF406_15575 [candidate division KSB1 bacterium]|nr:hypothetical protein [candidate division KSB1 bacterium]